ncbi:MAG: TetR family transcriptional regulator [Pseudolabrys sp.]
MGETGKRARALQERVIRTRHKVVNGAIKALATHGVTNLTHRAVARAAGVSLAATTYHYATKQDILAETSRILMDGYLDAFRRLETRLVAGQEAGLHTLEDLVMRVVGNALGRDRKGSLAWCELILHGGRNAEGRALAQRWYTRLDEIWLGISDRLPSRTGLRASAAIDLAVGLTILLHPLELDAKTALALLDGRAHLDQQPMTREIAAEDTAPDDPSGKDQGRHAATRERLVEAGIEILLRGGAASVSYTSVAERTGMVRSGPSYYFPTIDGLLKAAQIALFSRAKARYRAGIGSVAPEKIDKTRLADLTTAIFFHELLQFPHENLGYCSVWMNSVQNAALRPTVFGSLLDLNHAWMRRLRAATEGSVHAAAPLWLQGLFMGKLIRGIAAQPDTGDLSRSREDFAAIIQAMTK